MRLSRLNLLLTLLLLFAIVALLFQSSKLTSDFNFAGKRIDALEKRPVAQVVPYPEAGESAVVFSTTEPRASSTPFPNATASPTSASKQTIRPTVTPVNKPEKKITYLPIYGGGYQTTQTSWVDVPGSEFQLNINDYASGYATFEATAWVIGGSGNVKLRLLDITNGVAVDGSSIAGSSSGPALIISGRLGFFSGQNTYRVQLSSQTSSTVEFDFGRVKIVYY